MEQMGDMLDSAMRRVNVERQREIGACVLVDQKNVLPRREGVLYIKFSPVGIEQCEGEDWISVIVIELWQFILEV